MSTKLYGILALLAEQCPTFGRSSVALASGHLSEKLGDMGEVAQSLGMSWQWCLALERGDGRGRVRRK